MFSSLNHLCMSIALNFLGYKFWMDKPYFQIFFFRFSLCSMLFWLILSARGYRRALNFRRIEMLGSKNIPKWVRMCATSHSLLQLSYQPNYKYMGLLRFYINVVFMKMRLTKTWHSEPSNQHHVGGGFIVPCVASLKM